MVLSYTFSPFFACDIRHADLCFFIFFLFPHYSTNHIQAHYHSIHACLKFIWIFLWQDNTSLSLCYQSVWRDALCHLKAERWKRMFSALLYFQSAWLNTATWTWIPATWTPGSRIRIVQKWAWTQRGKHWITCGSITLLERRGTTGRPSIDMPSHLCYNIWKR